MVIIEGPIDELFLLQSKAIAMEVSIKIHQIFVSRRAMFFSAMLATGY